MSERTVFAAGGGVIKILGGILRCTSKKSGKPA